MQSNFQVTSQLNDEPQTCPAGKYWVKPHTRKKDTKAGQEYIENVGLSHRFASCSMT